MTGFYLASCGSSRCKQLAQPSGWASFPFMERADMLTAARLREVLNYDPAIGVFTWRVRTSTCVHVGDVAGYDQHKYGYRGIKIDGQPYLEHRLAWLWATGEWPKAQIDHVNLNKADNRLANLREATPSQNQGNKRIHAVNTSGFKGVCWHKRARKWQAGITINNKARYLGCFVTQEEASSAYAIAAEKHFGEFARHA